MRKGGLTYTDNSGVTKVHMVRVPSSSMRAGFQQWQLSTYADFVYSTETSRARNMSIAANHLEAGGDVVYVAPRSGCSERCRRFEGKLFSLSGTTTRWRGHRVSKLAFFLPDHPRCVHDFVPVG
jgi:hypothetical protein